MMMVALAMAKESKAHGVERKAFQFPDPFLLTQWQKSQNTIRGSIQAPAVAESVII
jgi:hypothetical protein